MPRSTFLEPQERCGDARGGDNGVDTGCG